MGRGCQIFRARTAIRSCNWQLGGQPVFARTTRNCANQQHGWMLGFAVLATLHCTSELINSPSKWGVVLVKNRHTHTRAKQ